MRRRRSNLDDDNIKLALAFHRYHLRNRLRTLAFKYSYVTPFPLTEDERADYFDRLFGEPELCEAATNLWMGTHNMHRAVRDTIHKYRHIRDSTPELNLITVPEKRHRFYMPMPNSHGVLFAVPMRTFYPTVPLGSGDIALYQSRKSNPVATRAMRTGPLRETDMRVYDLLCAWAKDVLTNTEEAMAALDGVHTAAQFAGTTHNLLSLLPGLADVCEAIGVPSDVMRDVSEPYRPKTKVDMDAMRRGDPAWSSNWLTQRATLIKMALLDGKEASVPTGTEVLWAVEDDVETPQ